MDLTSHRERAYAHIRQKMLLGDISLGARLSPGRLAREIGISTTPVREALTQLGTEGLLEQVPHYGTFVKQLSLEDVQELYELREILEGHAAERAATRITQEQLDQLQRLCDQLHTMCRQLRDEKWVEFPPEPRRQWVLIDVAFHLIILDASGSPRTRKIVSDLKLLSNLCGHVWVFPYPNLRQWHYWTWTDHLRVLRALRRQDGQAACRYMRNHICGALKGAMERYRPNDPEQVCRDLPESLRRTIGQMESLEKAKSRD